MIRALVTGGTRGIGKAIAAAILAEGGSVAITGRTQSGVDNVVREFTGEPGVAERVFGAVLNVRDRSSAEAVVAGVSQTLGGLNTLVNNAGIGVFKSVETMTPEEWDETLATNLTGAFYCSRAAIPELRRAGGGWIINVASLAGRHPAAESAAYCASKAGLIAFSDSLMLEVRAENIRVSVILPGSVATGFSHRSRNADDSWRLKPDDVARVVVDLLRHPDRSMPSRVEIRPTRTK